MFCTRQRPKTSVKCTTYVEQFIENIDKDYQIISRNSQQVYFEFPSKKKYIKIAIF